MPAAETSTVGGIDDGVDLKARDVSLPQPLAGSHHTLVSQLRLQLSVLRGNKLVAQRLWPPYIHQCPQLLFPVTQIPGNHSFCIILLQQIAYAEVNIFLSVH
jgi:hypothetical protein